MATSGEIAQMFTAQGEGFAARNTFANTIGIATPANSLGAYGHYGLMGGFQRAPGGFPGMHAPSPVWSYGAGGPVGVGYGAGSAFAGGAISAFGGAATLGVAGLGLAAGFGKLGGIGAAMFDPLTSGWGGFSAARALGGGMMGSLGMGAMAAMPALAIGAGLTHGIGSFVHGAQGQGAIAGQLGQHNFINPMSRTGMGFTRDDAKSFGDSVRQLAHVPEMLTSVDELTRLLPALRKAGQFQGIKDIGEFQDRFKESIKTIKTMSKMLGTTMEEATEFFAHSRSVGFLGKTAQLANTLNAQYTSGLSGMSMQQTMGLQQQGAAAFRSQGISGRIGAQAYTNWAQQLSYAQQNGLIGEGALEDMTGLQGPEAVAAASQRFANATYEMTQNTAAGRLLTYGMMSFDKNGKATGVDKDLLEKFKRGEVSYHELKARASRLTDTQKVSATARLKDVGGLLAGAGPDAIGRVLQDALTEQYGDSTKGREALNLMLQRNAGLSANESDIVMGQIGTGPSGAERETLAKTQMQRSLEKERYSPSAMWKRFKTKASHAMGFTALEQAGADMQNSFAKAYEEFWDDIFDRNVVQVSKQGADAFKQAMGGDTRELKKIFASAHGMDLGSAFANRSQNMMTGGRFAKMLVGGAVGIGAGLLTGGNVAIGAAAGYATMSAMDEWGGTKAIDRFLTGGLSDEEWNRRSATGLGWNKYKPTDLEGLYGRKGLSADRQAELRGYAAGDVYGLLESRKWKNAMGEEVSYNKLTAEERGDALRSGSGDHYAKKLAERMGIDEGTAKRALGAYFTGQTDYGAGFGGIDITPEMVEKAARGDATLSRGLMYAKESYAQDLANGVKRNQWDVDEMMAGGVALMAAGGKGINFAGTQGRSANTIMDIKAVAGLRKEVSDGLAAAGIDQGLQGQLAKSETARSLASAMASGDEQVLKAVREGNTEALKKRFPGITKADMDLANEAYLAAGPEGRKGLAGLLGKMGNLDSAEQRLAIQTAAKDTYESFAGDLSRSGDSLTDGQRDIAGRLSAALRTMGTSKDAGAVEGAFKDAQAEIANLVKAGADLSGESLDKYTAGLGQFGGRVKEAILASKKRSFSVKDIAQQTGMSEDSAYVRDLAAKYSGRTLSKDEAVELEGKIAGLKSGGDILQPGGTKGKGDKDAEIIATLKVMQKTSELQTSLLVASKTGMDEGDVIKLYDARVDPQTGRVVFGGQK